jgi:hypothetical protein
MYRNFKIFSEYWDFQDFCGVFRIVGKKFLDLATPVALEKSGYLKISKDFLQFFWIFEYF